MLKCPRADGYEKGEWLQREVKRLAIASCFFSLFPFEREMREHFWCLLLSDNTIMQEHWIRFICYIIRKVFKKTNIDGASIAFWLFTHVAYIPRLFQNIRGRVEGRGEEGACVKGLHRPPPSTW